MLQIGAALFYYKLGQTLPQVGAASLLQIRASVVTNWRSYYKSRQPLLQNRAAIRKWGQNLLPVRTIITNWVITGLINFLKSTLQSSISIKYINNYSKCVNVSKLLRSSYSYHYFLCKCFAEMSLKAYNVLQKSE